MSDDLTLSASGRDLAGWEQIAVTLHAEAFPTSFEVSLSSRDPATSKDVIVKPGDACTVKLGADTVITGYIDRVGNSGSAQAHTLHVTGRGKTQDLVDCSAEWDSGQIPQSTALDIVTKLAKPYGITVKLANGAAPGPSVPQFNLNYGETAADIIQRVARNAGLLAYEDAEGTLLLASVGTDRAASGIIYGGNVEQWSVELSMDERYSEIVCTMAAQNVIADVAGGNGFFFHTAKDPNVTRHRRLYLPLQQAAEAIEFTEKMADWEAARRAGRSTATTVSIDSWRDSKGKLFMPNTLVPVRLPGLPKETDLVISQATFRRGEDGTHADLMLMPPAAFTPQPINLQPLNLSDISSPDA